MKNFILKSVMVMRGLLLGVVMAALSTSTASFADKEASFADKEFADQKIISKMPVTTALIDAKVTFEQSAFVMVKYETAKTAAATPFAGSGPAIMSNAVMTISSLPGETAVMTCNIQNGSATTRRDCTGGTGSNSYAVTGERRFGNDVDLGTGLLRGIDGGAHNNIEIDVSYL